MELFDRQVDEFLKEDPQPELPPNVSMDKANLTDEEKRRLTLVLSKYMSIYNLDKTDIGQTNRAITISN
jgi:hypothetical protein